MQVGFCFTEPVCQVKSLQHEYRDVFFRAGVVGSGKSASKRTYRKELGICVILVLCVAAGIWQAANRGYSGQNDYAGSWAQVADILAAIKVPSFAERDFDVTDYGAVGDGKTDCKQAFDKAILACCYAGGGRVIVPAGTYLVNGPIHFESDINLHLAEGARIVFGTNFEDYLPPALSRWAGTRIYNYSPMIYAYRKKNIALTGKGVLDAQAHDTWCRWVGKSGQTAKEVRRMNREDVPVVDRMFGAGHNIRPSMIVFFGCENVLVEGVKIVDAPAWCVQPVFSKNITIRNISFEAPNPNNDGIDIDSCQNVHIHGVVFDNADDCIALKSGRGPEGRRLARPTRNVYIHDCLFNTYTGIAIGSEMSGGVYNVFAENCRAAGEVKRAFYIKGNRSRGGEVAHIRFRNMKFLSAREEMLGISAHYGSVSPDELQDFPPYFHDIRFENITASGPCKVALVVKGQSDSLVEDVVLKDVTVTEAFRAKETADARGVVMRNVVFGGVVQADSGNLPPDVYAGADQFIDPNSGGAVTLRGTVADDGRPAGKLSYLWSLDRGLSDAVKIVNPRALETRVEFSSPGKYVLKLVADDGDLRGSHTVIFQVGKNEGGGH